METFRILCFSGVVLLGWEERQAANVVECLSSIEANDCSRIEVWKGEQRVAVLKRAGSPEQERPLRRGN